SIGVCFGFALLADMVGYSVALGAFLGGTLVGESGRSELIEKLTQPVRDIFAAIFFISVGMMIDPLLVAEHWPAIVVLTVIVVLGKLVGVSLGVFLTGEGVRMSIKAGMSLAQIGEFSFIIASVGLASGATGSFLYPVAVTVSAATTLLTPWLIRSSDRVADFADRRLPEAAQTFAALYGTWLEQLRTRPRTLTVGRRIRRLGGLLLVDMLLIVVVVIATTVWGPELADLVEIKTPVSEEFTWFVVIAGAFALMVPLGIGIARCTAALARTLAVSALPQPETGTDLADAPRRALVVTLEIAILLLVGVPLVAVTSPFLPPLPGPLLMAIVIVLLALALRRNAKNLHEHARAGAQAIAEVMGRQLKVAVAGAPGASPDLHLLHDMLPGLGDPQPIRVAADSPAVGRSLAALNLRGLTGATVLAIIREHEGVLVPAGSEIVKAGDLIAVAGTAGAIENAREQIGGPVSREAAT
ncbi:MAG: cation:proton antiporter, partial [Candidatus Binatia bacterium]